MQTGALLLLIAVGSFSIYITVTAAVLSECSENESSAYCTSVPSNSSCTNYDTYFQYTEDIDLLELESKAMDYIEKNVTNQYCRNYLKAALCVTIYPPCDISSNGSIQRLCPGQCDSLLNNSSCSSDTEDVTEFISSEMGDPVINFTIDCSNSLSFANTFLNMSLCSTNSCISILDSAEVPNTCWKLDFLHQTVCANFSLATDSYIYGYASRENITEFSRILERITPVIDFQFFCTRFAAYYFCNYGFIPCDVTTGAPRAICAESCNYLHDHCSGTYLQVVTLGGVFGQTIKDNCENTLSHIQEDYGFPCSSSSLQNECIDLLRIPGEDYIPSNLTSTVTDVNQSTCQVDFATINNPLATINQRINNQTTTNDQLMTSTINVITPMNDTFNATIDSATPSATTNSPIMILAASVAGGILWLCAIFICIVGLFVIKKRKRNKIREGIFTTQSLTSLFNGNTSRLKNAGVHNPLEISIYTEIDLSSLKIECKHLDKLLVSASDIKFDDLLGEGEFGCVYKGIWTQTTVEKEEISDVVAIKTVKNYNENLQSFLNECILMKNLNHPNVLPILGICLESNDEIGLPFMLLPFMVNGDLRSYLKKKRKNAVCVDQFPEDLNENDLLNMCYQIACGMSYLTSKRFVHRDLAARNCMVDTELHIKVADFGLARDVYMTEYYRQQSTGKIPAKWMAPESLHDRISNEKTDVWSYGITCWEVFSLGRTPYPTISNYEILKYLDEGNRLPKPNLCSDDIYTLMLKCWERDTDDRPCFKDIVKEIGEAVGK